MPDDPWLREKYSRIFAPSPAQLGAISGATAKRSRETIPKNQGTTLGLEVPFTAPLQDHPGDGLAVERTRSYDRAERGTSRSAQ